jgi:hypothetical protein
MSLTEQQAYDAMFLFLHRYWERTGRHADDVAGLLGSLNRGLADDGRPADPAMAEDWAACVERIEEGFDPYSALAQPE